MYYVHVRVKENGSWKQYPLLNHTLSIDSPVVTEHAGNTPDTFSFSIPVTHPHYDKIELIKTHIVITDSLSDNAKYLFRGRVTGVSQNFYKTMSVECESDMGYLYDSIVPPFTFNGSLGELFEALLDRHNQQMDSERQFSYSASEINISKYDHHDFSVKSTEYSSTLSVLNNELVSKFGGYLHMKYLSNGKPAIVYNDIPGMENYNDPDDMEAQDGFNFSINLADLSIKRDINDFATALIATGGVADPGDDEIGSWDDDDEGTHYDDYGYEIGADGDEIGDGFIVIADNTNIRAGGRKGYVWDKKAVAEYGYIWRHESWSEITDENDLEDKAMDRLEQIIHIGTKLTISGVEMRDLGINTERMRTGYLTRIYSRPHGVSGDYILEERTRNLLNPDKDSFSFGEPAVSLTGASVKHNNSLSHDDHNASASDIKTGNFVIGGKDPNKYGSIIIKNDNDEVIMVLNSKMGFTMHSRYGRPVFQSIDESTGISSNPDKPNQFHLWAGYKANDKRYGNVTFGVLNKETIINGTLMYNGKSIEDYFEEAYQRGYSDGSSNSSGGNVTTDPDNPEYESKPPTEGDVDPDDN